MNIPGLIFAFFLLIVIFGGFFLIPIVAIVISKREERREKRELPEKVRKAIEKITADGKVEAPKGPYVRRKRRGAITDHSTSAPRHSGMSNHPWG